MPLDDRDVLQAALRNDLTTFIERSFRTLAPKQEFLPNWHIDAISWNLRQCYERQIRRLIISMPPRYLKSICASVAFPAWVLGKDPTAKIISVSYANSLTEKHARDCRSVMQSQWYKEAFPETRIDPNKNTVFEFETTRHGFRLGTSVGGTLTGRGGNIIIVDDPMKPDDALSDTRRQSVHQWFDNTLYSRLDSKSRDVIIIVMQRLHVDDLVGYVTAKEEWAHLSLPAIAEIPVSIRTGDDTWHDRSAGDLLHPAREPTKTLDELRASMGTSAFEAQYQQRPVPPGGNMIKWSWFQTYSQMPPRMLKDKVVQSWDTASKTGVMNDYSVCTTWLIKDEEYYLIDVLRDRFEYPDLKRQIGFQALKHHPHYIVIEDAGAGTHLIQDVRRDKQFFPKPFKPTDDKRVRMEVQTHIIENQQVFVPERAPWLAAFQAEVMQFPSGRHDDQVDSMSQFFTWWREHKRRRPTIRDW